MKTNKIQVSTVRKTANVQVIELNAAFIARVVEAKIIAKTVVNTHEAMLEDDECRSTHDLAAIKGSMDAARTVLSLLEDINAAFLANDVQDDEQDDD